MTVGWAILIVALLYIAGRGCDELRAPHQDSGPHHQWPLLGADRIAAQLGAKFCELS